MKYLSAFLILASVTSALAQQGSGVKGATKSAAAALSVNTGAGSAANFSAVVVSGQATQGGTNSGGGPGGGTGPAPSPGASPSPDPGGENENGAVNFVVKNTCFGTNLRMVTNPLSPIAVVRMNIGLLAANGVRSNYWLQYPASTVTAAGVGQVMTVDSSMLSHPSQMSATILNNIVRFKIPLEATTVIDAKGKMSFTRNAKIVSIKFEQDLVEVQADTQPNYPLFASKSKKLCQTCDTPEGAKIYLIRAMPFISKKEGESFFLKYPLLTKPVSSQIEYNLAYQKWYNWFQEGLSSLRAGGKRATPYMGLPGDLAARLSINESRDGKMIEVNAHFPGQQGYCGGYSSPLMVFFDEKRPKFTGESNFPLQNGKITWPEKGAPGYFIAYDRISDGVITRKDELFGNDEKFANGFEALRVFDTNKDGVIDRKDKEFGKLLLWQDKNGDGISTEDEISKLQKRIKSISLNYDHKEVSSFGNRAEVKEKSTFVFIDNEKEKTGQVLDIWFTSPNGL